VKSGASRGEQFHSKSEEAALERYELFLARNNAFDFDDLIQKPVYIFEQRPAILAKYQERYTHILVDEYQDVSPGQYRLIRFLAGHRNQVSVVGDDAQMIYGWRYANIDTFLGFERDWPRARVVFLEENYRSSGTIVQAASAVIAHNEVAREKNLWTRNNDGEPITILEAGDEDEEAEWIAEEVEKVKRLKGEKENATFSPSHLLTSPTIAILYRTNAQSRALEQALIRRNIPYRIYGGLKFYERREIKDIVAALRLALNPRDELSRERLEKAFRLRTFREILPVLHASSAQAPAAAIQSFLAAASYFEYLERETMNPEERRENIEELVSFAEGFTDIPSFLEHVALVQSTDDVNASRQSQSANRNPGSDANSSRLAISDLQAPPVHLSTIHLAKGLEFDYVFLAGCAEGLLPHARSVESEEELEEERRLMYVAMTRARKELAISFYGIPSRFIGEIPPEFAEFLRLENDSGATENEPEVQLLE
jgi:DNA helicase-2/ATP-dependent DNA helicase PcrA